MALFIEPRQDKYGNREYKLAVIEGNLKEGEFGPSIEVKAPLEFADSWPTVSPRFFREVSAEAGPARLLDSIEEMDKLLEKYSLKADNASNCLTLRNGDSIPKGLVITTMVSLNQLMQENPIAAYELFQLCKDGNHELFGNTSEILGNLGLIQNGEVHDSIRSIVLSAFEGKGLDMHIVNPVTQ